LWFLFAAVAAFVCLGLPLLAPLILYAPALTSSSRMGARRIAAVIGAGTSAIVLGWLLVTALAAHRPRFHEEAVGFLTVAEVCARGVRCPLVGQPMIYGIHLGPAFYQVLALLQRVADPRWAYFTLLQAQQLVAAALLGWAAYVALRGGPWGVVAAASLYFSETFSSQLQDPVHATLALLPGAGF